MARHANLHDAEAHTPLKDGIKSGVHESCIYKREFIHYLSYTIRLLMASMCI